MFDIDNFKIINDTKGHVYGDRVLVDVAAILKRCVRDTDFVGRYGGEEFLVVLPGTNADKAVFIAERIRLAIAAHRQEEGLSVTVSGGAHPHMGEDLDAFIAQADAKRYQAKKNGKNQICSR